MSNYQFTEVQEAWLQKLESDEMQDKQGRGQLIDSEGKMCCLGVLCSLQPDVAIIENNFYFGEDLLDSIPVETITDRVGLRTCDGSFVAPVLYEDRVGWQVKAYTLTTLNDGAKWTFKQIASYIRANPENVFKKGAE